MLISIALGSHRERLQTTYEKRLAASLLGWSLVCPLCRTRLRVWASAVKVLSVGNLSVRAGKINVGGLYHFILLLLS